MYISLNKRTSHLFSEWPECTTPDIT